MGETYGLASFTHSCIIYLAIRACSLCSNHL